MDIELSKTRVLPNKRTYDRMTNGLEREFSSVRKRQVPSLQGKWECCENVNFVRAKVLYI